MRRCLDDVDDEVRDRAAMYLAVLKDDPLADTLVRDGQSICSHHFDFGFLSLKVT